MPGDEIGVPLTLRAAAGWTWRVLVVAGGIYALLQLLATFEVLVVPVLVAVLLTAGLRPLADLFARRLPRGAAAFAAILVALGVVIGLIALVGQQASSGFDDLQAQAARGWDELRRELAGGPLHLGSAQVDQLLDDASAQIEQNRDRLVTGAVRVGSTAVDVTAGFFIVLFSTFFFLSGGEGIWRWVVGLFPRAARDEVHEAGRRAWTTLTAYVRATVVVAFTDGAGVALVAALIGVPLAVPLGVLVFLGAFVPVVGALITGIVAVLVAFVAKGYLAALLMLAGVIAVQQIESHVLQPFLMGRAVAVHPLGVILSIGAGVLVAGIVGGLFAVPLAATANVVGRYLAGRDEPEPQPEAQPEPQPDPEPDPQPDPEPAPQG